MLLVSNISRDFMKFNTSCPSETNTSIHKIYPGGKKLPILANDNRYDGGTLARNLDCLPGYKFDSSPGDDSLEDKVIDSCTPLLDVNDSGIDINGDSRTLDSPESDNAMVASPLCGSGMTNYNIDKKGISEKPPLVPKRPFFCKVTNNNKRTPAQRPAELILNPVNGTSNSFQGVSPQETFTSANKFLNFSKSDSCPNKLSSTNKDSTVFHLPAVKRSSPGNNNQPQNCVRKGSSDLDRSPLDNRGVGTSCGHGSNGTHVREADIDNMFQKSTPDVLIHNSPKSDRLDLFPHESNPSTNININTRSSDGKTVLPSIVESDRLRQISGDNHWSDVESVNSEDKSRIRDVTRNMFGIIKDLNAKDRSHQIRDYKRESSVSNGVQRRESPRNDSTNGAQPQRFQRPNDSRGTGLNPSKPQLKQKNHPEFHPNRWLIESENVDSDEEPTGTCKIDFFNLLNEISNTKSLSTSSGNSKGVISSANRISPFTKSSPPPGSKRISPLAKTSPVDSMDSLERLSIRATNLRVTPSKLKKLKSNKDGVSSSQNRTNNNDDDTYHVYETIPGDMDYADLEKLRQNGLLPKLTSVPNLPGTFIPITPPDLPERGYRQKVEPEMDVGAIEASADDNLFHAIPRKRSLPSIPDDIRSEASGYAKIDDSNDNSHSDPNDNGGFSPSRRRRAFTRNPLNRSLPEPPRSKRSPKRDNLYFLLANKESRNQLSNSLENETKIDNRLQQSNNIETSALNGGRDGVSKPTRRVKATYV